MVRTPGDCLNNDLGYSWFCREPRWSTSHVLVPPRSSHGISVDSLLGQVQRLMSWIPAVHEINGQALADIGRLWKNIVTGRKWANYSLVIPQCEGVESKQRCSKYRSQLKSRIKIDCSQHWEYLYILFAPSNERVNILLFDHIAFQHRICHWFSPKAGHSRAQGTS